MNETIDIKKPIEDLAYKSLLKAIDLAGTHQALSDLIRGAGRYCRPSFVGVWKERRKMGPSFCIAAERALNGAVKRHELRPDWFDREK